MMKMTHAVLTAAALTLVCATNADILSGPVTNTSNGHLYYLLTTNTWTGAEAEAVSLGGHLITISDAAENDWVCTNFLNYAGGPRALWIGLFQPPGSPEPTGGWIWSSGEPVSYTNWTSGEPNNNSAHGPQNWAMIWPVTATNNVTPYRDKTWNDSWDLPDTATGVARNTYGLHGVVEVAPSQPPGTPTNSFIRTAVEIAWPSQSSKYYRVQWSPEIASTNGFADTNWFDLAFPVRGTGPTNYYFDTTRSSEKRFYRVLTLP